MKKIYKVAVVSADGEVENIILAPDGYELTQGKTPIILGTMYNDTDMVQTYKGRLPAFGDLWDGAAFVAPPAKVEELLAHAAACRYQKETQGIVFNGKQFPTTREFRTALVEIIGTHPTPNGGTIAVKVGGSFHTFTNLASLSALQAAISVHVQECFTTEMEVHSKIMQGLITKKLEIDQMFGP